MLNEFPIVPGVRYRCGAPEEDRLLIALNDERAKDIALKISDSESYVGLWEDAFNYLSTIKSEEIEDFFVNFLINDEGIRPYLTRIADEYLRGD
jgi:hypothetical protein